MNNFGFGFLTGVVRRAAVCISLVITSTASSISSLILRSNEMVFFSSHDLNAGQSVLLLDNPEGEPSLKGIPLIIALVSCYH